MQTTLEIAETFIAAAKEKASKLGVPMTICVLDAGGHMVAQVRMDGAPFAGIASSHNKAYTSIAVKVPSGKLGERINGDQQVIAALASGIGPRFVLTGGGFPLVIGGETIGSVGISGGPPAQDTLCAKAGFAAVGADS